ncbi:MAG: hypothetical protein Q4G43_09985 [Mobilicoccus sp.]|nr:hypothetical protein [Mobilicoccus sp.]
MSKTPLRATLSVLTVLTLGILTALVATSTGGHLTWPWWTLAIALCALLPLGSWSAASARSRVLASGAMALACALFVGGLAVSTSGALVAIVVAPLWFAVAGLITPWLRGHRLLSLTIFGGPVVMTAAAVPAAMASSAEFAGLDLAAAARAVVDASGPALLLGGAAALLGSVTDLLLRLRTTVTPTVVRSVTATLTGLTLASIGTAGVVAARATDALGAAPTSPERFGTLGSALALLAVLTLAHGLMGLARTDVGLAGSVILVLATLAVATGAILLPTDPLTVALGLALLLGVGGMLGSVAGLCAAAALLRTSLRLPSRPHLPVPAVLQRVGSAALTVRDRALAA